MVETSIGFTGMFLSKNSLIASATAGLPPSDAHECAFHRQLCWRQDRRGK
jgi:hypothetical protein